ncbi:unnamed protein product, partial [Urochloa humidicola]
KEPKPPTAARSRGGQAAEPEMEDIDDREREPKEPKTSVPFAPLSTTTPT